MIPRRRKSPRMGVRHSGVVRDRKYLDWLREQPCVVTSLRLNVDPCHIGQRGMGMKSSDDEALPIGHNIHQQMHNTGEISTLRELAPDWLLREALRAYAREMYQRYRREHRK